jgi:hypothetical protein
MTWWSCASVRPCVDGQLNAGKGARECSASRGTVCVVRKLGNDCISAALHVPAAVCLIICIVPVSQFLELKLAYLHQVVQSTDHVFVSFASRCAFQAAPLHQGLRDGTGAG